MAEVNQSSILIAGSSMSMDDIKAKAAETQVQPNALNQENSVESTKKVEAEYPELEQLFEEIDEDNEENKLDRKVRGMVEKFFNGQDIGVDILFNRLEIINKETRESGDYIKAAKIEKQIASYKAIVKTHALHIQKSAKDKQTAEGDGDNNSFSKDVLEKLQIATGQNDAEQLEIDFLDTVKKLSENENLTWEDLKNNPDLVSSSLQQFLFKEMKVSGLLRSQIQLMELGQNEIIEKVILGIEAGDNRDGDEDPDYLDLFVSMDAAFEAANVPALLDLIFAIDGYRGSGDSLFRRGVEKKQDENEKKTLSLLKKTCESDDKKTTFFAELLKADNKNINDVENVRRAIYEQFDIETISDEKKPEKIEQLKKQLKHALERALESSAEKVPEHNELNLSRDVIQFILLQSETFKKEHFPE